MFPMLTQSQNCCNIHKVEKDRKSMINCQSAKENIRS